MTLEDYLRGARESGNLEFTLKLERPVAGQSVVVATLTPVDDKAPPRQVAFTGELAFLMPDAREDPRR